MAGNKVRVGFWYDRCYDRLKVDKLIIMCHFNSMINPYNWICVGFEHLSF